MRTSIPAGSPPMIEQTNSFIVLFFVREHPSPLMGRRAPVKNIVSGVELWKETFFKSIYPATGVTTRPRRGGTNRYVCKIKEGTKRRDSELAAYILGGEGYCSDRGEPGCGLPKGKEPNASGVGQGGFAETKFFLLSEPFLMERGGHREGDILSLVDTPDFLKK